MKRIVLVLVGIVAAHMPAQAGLLDFFRNPKPRVYTHPVVDRVVNAIVTPERVRIAGYAGVLGVTGWSIYNYKNGVKSPESQTPKNAIENPSLIRRMAHKAIVGIAYTGAAALAGHIVYDMVKGR